MVLKSPQDLKTCVKEKSIFFNKAKIPFFKTKRAIGVVKPLQLKFEDDDLELSDEEEIIHASIVPRMRTNEKIFQNSHKKETRHLSTTSIIKKISAEIFSHSEAILAQWSKYLCILNNESVNIENLLKYEYQNKLNDAFKCFIFPQDLEAKYQSMITKKEYQQLLNNVCVILIIKTRY